METNVITLPLFHVAGYRIEANINEFESGLGKSIYHSLIERKDEIRDRKNENVILMQIYPMKPDFNPQVDKFTNIICYEISKLDEVPLNMISHTVNESKYVTFTHKGLESELDHSYDYIYGQWIKDTGNEPKDYDFEIWGEKYNPESSDNEIELFIALK
ncbi:GyrI-like domain-containing protein [Paenibacillus peoriae]|uniref:Transcriptional regulator YdeE n=1 Tax=Paenibacillus peoriae TaxID=59893 RepID=A0ABU1QMR4_9BACL|nr:GyrI-like domain-containing protein [Paenibacillus peoriae]MDR6780095.1 putative transcriptional regulator YdeE [Paenibacillus peoriae]OMF77305.1 AraC family transcriptional regulator [Paenibacillus peoriae]